MEDSLITFLVLFGVSVPTLALVYLTKFSKNKQKKATKTVKEENFDSVVQTYANTVKVLSEQNEFLVAENKTIKKRLAAEIGVNMKAEQEEIAVETKVTDKNLEELYEIDIENGLKLVESLNLPVLANMDKSKIPSLMNNPMVKNLIWNHIKKNKDEMISLGVIIPKGSIPETKSNVTDVVQQENNSMMNLEFSDLNAKHMA